VRSADGPSKNPILTSDNYLDSVVEYLPRELVPPEALVTIRGIARLLPPVSTVGFEAHLGTAVSRVDFAVCIRPSECRWLNAGCPWPDLAGRGGESPAWKKLRDLTECWEDSTCSLNSGIYNLWLEFDVQFPVIPVPNVLIGLRGSSEAVSIAQAATDLLLGNRIANSTWRSVETCFGAMPAGGHVFQIGVWLARPLDGLRVCVHGIPIKQIPSYLSSIGWRGDGARLQKMLPCLDRLTHSVAIDLDLVQEVLPRLGIECLPVEARRPEFDTRWKVLLDSLVADGLCTHSQQAALLSWPGYNHRRLIWPSVFVRGLNHVKLVLEPNGEVQAKAYFGFVHVWGGDPAGASLTQPLFGCGDLHDA
jgi:hypothetical protein